MKHNNIMKTKRILKNLFFFLPFLTLLVISLFLMYHAQFIMDTYSMHFKKQLLWFGCGIFLLLLSPFLSTKKFFSFSFLLYLLNVFFLGLVLIIGKDVNGAKAWIDLKYFNFQPSELMKLTYSLFLAHFISNKKFKNWWDEFLFLVLICIFFAVPSILIFLEPDTGAIIFLGIITLVLLWNSQIHKRWFFFLGILILGVFCGFFYCYFFQKDFLISILGTSFFYRVERIFDFKSGMQIENALIAIGSAPILRFSLYETGIYIPESPTDFVFALSSNVFGLFGNILILFCFLVLDCYFISYYQDLKRKEEKLFTLSFLSIFFFSQWINISMNLGLIPIIGIPLPFISYGGSSTIVLFLYLAILFSFKYKKRQMRKVAKSKKLSIVSFKKSGILCKRKI